MEQEVERYRKPTRILHWVHAGAFVLLFLTGLVLFVPSLGILAQDSWTRVIHRVAAVVFIIAPLIYIPLNLKATFYGIKDALSWGREDLGWMKAAPRYYFLCDEAAMPPQEHMNTGQKMWWLLVLVFGPVVALTGLIMWVFKTTASAELLQFMVLLHDLAFLVLSLMFFVHIYMSVAHPLVRPLRTGAWSSMVRGKVSAEYAKSHHGKWYQDITRAKEIVEGKEQ